MRKRDIIKADSRQAGARRPAPKPTSPITALLNRELGRPNRHINEAGQADEAWLIP